MRYSEFQTDILSLAYRIFRENGLVKSQADFSLRILGRAPAYFSSMMARKRVPSTQVMRQLRDETQVALAGFLANPHLGQPYAVKVNEAHERLSALAQMLEVNLRVPN